MNLDAIDHDTTTAPHSVSALTKEMPQSPLPHSPWVSDTPPPTANMKDVAQLRNRTSSSEDGSKDTHTPNGRRHIDLTKRLANHITDNAFIPLNGVPDTVQRPSE